MRAILSFALAASAALSQAQISGTYTPKGGQPHPWQINPAHTLVWDSTPYLPVGLHIDGTPDEVARAKAAGVGDVILDLPVNGTGWAQTLQAIEKNGMRYLLQINSLAPMAEGVAIEPAGYRITGILKPQKMSINLPGAFSALTVILNKRDSSISRSARVPVTNGVLTMDVKPLGLEQILVIYPEMRSLEMPDLWDAMDEHRDRLLITLKNSPLGAGLRGIINPLGRLGSNQRANVPFVPTSPYFRYEFADYLKRKYKNVETTMRTWSMTVADIDSFEQLARLAPLWSNPNRGVSQLWDTDSDKLYACNSVKSQIWADIREVINTATTRRYKRLVDAIHTVANVPVLQEWSGWSQYVEDNPPIDGLAMRASGGTRSVLLDSASRASSTILRWRRSGWLLGSEIDAGSGDEAARGLTNMLDDLTSLGARGWFLRSGSPEVLKALASELGRTSDVSRAQYAPSALYFPENATFPATPQQLPAGYWWLPSPASGNRIDLGTEFFAYRYQEGGKNYIALWTSRPEGRVKLHLVDTKSPTFLTIDGSNPNPKRMKDGIEVTVGQIPLLIQNTEEIPIPDPSLQETLLRVAELFRLSDQFYIDITEPRYTFNDALAGFPRNPGGSFDTMRNQYDRLSLRLAKYTWIEAEAIRDNNFSEVVGYSGCSNGAALALRTQIANPGTGYYADYTVPVRSQEDQEVWIAARIPAEQRSGLVLTVAGQEMHIESDPIGNYGNGFAWYRLGTTRLGGNNTKLHLDVNVESADLAIDAIVLFPGRFMPHGVDLPDPVVFPQIKKGKG